MSFVPKEQIFSEEVPRLFLRTCRFRHGGKRRASKPRLSALFFFHLDVALVRRSVNEYVSVSHMYVAVCVLIFEQNYFCCMNRVVDEVKPYDEPKLSQNRDALKRLSLHGAKTLSSLGRAGI